MPGTFDVRQPFLAISLRPIATRLALISLVSNSNVSKPTRLPLVSSLQSLLFETTACLRDAGTSPPCPGQGQPLFELVSHGLSAAFAAFVDRARLFAQAPLSELVPNSTMFQEIWALGTYDLTGGLGKIRSMIVHETGTQLAVIELVHILVLVVIVLTAGVSYWTLLPLIMKTHMEARRVADLLADLPPELQASHMPPIIFTSLASIWICFDYLLIW